MGLGCEVLWGPFEEAVRLMGTLDQDWGSLPGCGRLAAGLDGNAADRSPGPLRLAALPALVPCMMAPFMGRSMHDFASSTRGCVNGQVLDGF